MTKNEFLGVFLSGLNFFLTSREGPWTVYSAIYMYNEGFLTPGPVCTYIIVQYSIHIVRFLYKTVTVLQHILCDRHNWLSCILVSQTGHKIPATTPQAKCGLFVRGCVLTGVIGPSCLINTWRAKHHQALEAIM